MAFSLRQQIPFRRLVALAWATHCNSEGIPPKDRVAKETWYRQQLLDAIGVSTTKAANPRTHFVPAMARFERIAGEDIYWQTRNGGPDDDRLRRLRFALDELMTEHDVSQEYVLGISRQMFDSTDPSRWNPQQVEAIITALKKQLGIYHQTPLKYRRPQRAASLAAAAMLALLAMIGMTGCATDPAVWLVNGCVIVAANREAALDAQHSLDKKYWRQLIMIQYKDRPQLGHCYLYYEIGNSAQAYDEGGTRWLSVRSRKASVIGAQLAGANLLSATWLQESSLQPDDAAVANPTPAAH